MRFNQTALIVVLLAWPLPGVGAEPAASAPGAINQLTPTQIAEGWINLFDGETTFGWQPTSDANWQAKDGEIQVSEGAEGFLMTTTEFADYELHVEFKAPAATNSGVFLRTPLEPTDPTKDCIELNIAPQDNPFPTGSLVGRHRWPAETLKIPFTSEGESGDWYSFDVSVNRNLILVNPGGGDSYSNGSATPLRGRIGLQFREGPVAFRNIRLKPLGLKPMLNGQDLAGWNTDKVEVAKYEVVPQRGRESFATSEATKEPTSPVAKDSRPLPAESELHVTSGRGQLETEASYADFIMQLDCFVDGDGLNSGVFFRSIPRDFANGYEAQIQNAVKDNDLTKPVDAGTGAIYRRTTARRVVSKDREWFTMTLIPTGAHIAVWVNGYQVTDWTDDRKPDSNPRKGLRTEAGTISLQAHDPTTNLRFRNLRIAEFPKATHIAE